MAAARIIGLTYIRLARGKTPVITTEATAFHIGREFARTRKTAQGLGVRGIGYDNPFGHVAAIFL